MSQASAGRVHHGNTQVRSRSAAWAASRSGTWYWSTWIFSVRSITGFTVTVVPGTPHQARTWSASTNERVFATRARCSFSDWVRGR